MRLTTIVIGDEILIGQVTDTNSGAVARTFGPLGWEIDRVLTVPDDRDAIKDAVTAALSRSELVVTTGGLGPTKDDITKNVLLEIFGGTLIRDHSVTDNIKKVFELRGLTMNPLTADQALVPDSCKVIQNRYGTAPIMVFERDGRMLVSMPGVPFETEGMLPEVAEMVKARFNPSEELPHASVMVSGITESALSSMLESYESGLDADLHLAYLPTPGLLRLRLDGKGRQDSDIVERHRAALDRLRATLGSLMVYDGDATAAEIVLSALRSRHMKFATAESCTGGNIAHAITAVAGCSDIYVGSVVSYANEVKTGVLGVDETDLAREGAVSRPVVEQMALGVCRRLGADAAVATSGIAGPGGGTPDKPVGTVWIAAAVNGRVASKKLRLPGNRARVIDRATTDALLFLLTLL